MPTQTIHRNLDQGRGPSRERLFDALRLGDELYPTVDIWLAESARGFEDSGDVIRNFLMQQRAFHGCLVVGISHMHAVGDPWWVELATLVEVEGQYARVILGFSYDHQERSSREGVDISWTSDRCHDPETQMGCGELLWPGDGLLVCQNFSDCCIA